MKTIRIVSFILCLLMFIGLLPAGTVVAASESFTTVLACSDFQNPSGNEAGITLVKSILSSVAQYGGVTSADGFLCCGDYDYEYVDTKNGIDSLKTAVKDVVTENMVFTQGNHDITDFQNTGLSLSGDNDPDNNKYGVFNINEDDYMWNNTDEERIKRTAQNLIDYLNEKLEQGFDKPIFVVSHLPLHYSMRTKLDGDARHANYIFDVLNEAGSKGLNIIYMYGHDHSNGWDDYLGASAVYLKKGDNILIAQNSKNEFNNEELNFTYVNPGFIGYYNNHNGGDDTLTMTVWKIYDDKVEAARYSSEGVHNIKSAGVTNAYKNESGYNPNTAVYSSPQSITLTSVIDSTPIDNLIEPPATKGERYERITALNSLTNGKYLLVYNGSDTSNCIMLPSVVSKSNQGGSVRVGFDLENNSYFGADVVYGNFFDKQWTLTKSGNDWYLGNGTDKAYFSDTSSSGIAAMLGENGDLFTISGSADAFTFKCGTVYLNYNSRGLINGYASNPAPFYLYKFTGYTIDVESGSTSVKYADTGSRVTAVANTAPEGYEFDKWVAVNGTVSFNDESSSRTTFIMPAEEISIKATYKELPPPPPEYDITVTDGVSSIAKGEEGTTVTITANAAPEGYEFDKWEAVTGTVTFADETASETTFEMPAETVSVKATYKQVVEWKNPFTDVKKSNWYYEAVKYANQNGLMNGVSTTRFAPDETVTRAMLVTVLYRIEGQPKVNKKTTFKDVKSDSYYEKAVVWAQENGIVNGISETEFRPNARITREQIAAIMYRYSTFKGYDVSVAETTDISSFSDANKISDYAVTAVKYAVGAGIIKGKTEKTVAPKDDAKRSEIATILQRFIESNM